MVVVPGTVEDDHKYVSLNLKIMLKKMESRIQENELTSRQYKLSLWFRDSILTNNMYLIRPLTLVSIPVHPWFCFLPHSLF